jgi:toxin ParE1/3/4
MKPVELAPAAHADLAAIGLYIAKDNPARALSFVDELEACAMRIGAQPLAHPARDGISPGLRSAVHGRYLILFRNLPDVVRIVRILHGARDLPALQQRGALE